MQNDYKCDAFGNLDTDHYVEKAYELRRAYHAQAMKKTVTSVKSWLVNLTTNRSFKAASQNQAIH